MKRRFIVLALFVFVCASGFCQAQDDDSFGGDTAKLAEFSVRDIKFLEHAPKFINLLEYQTPQGERIPYKEVNALLLSLPENKPLMRRHRVWRVVTNVCVGVLLASIATEVTCTFVDDMPHKTAVETASLVAGSCGFFGSLLSGYVSVTPYLKAVDNYNKNLVLTEAGGQ